MSDLTKVDGQKSYRSMKPSDLAAAERGSKNPSEDGKKWRAKKRLP